MKKISSTLFLLLVACLAIAQKAITVSGTVTNENKEPLIGVTVVVEGNETLGTVTDIDGKYSIAVKPNSILSFSYIGYESQKLVVTTNTSVDLVMKEDIKALDEVVVIGYGTTKKSDLTGSVATLKSESLEKSTMISIANSMQGRISGVNVTTNENSPGGGISLNIRGQSTITGSGEPLYVIDGIPLSVGDFGSSGDNVFLQQNSNPLAGLNPADIASIEVLKDASATAIYGSRAANGVVLITTKRSSTNDLKVEYSGSVGIAEVANKIDMLQASGYYEYMFARDPRDVIFTDTSNRFYRTPENFATAVGPDWQDELYRTALTHNHQIGISGGKDNTKFRASLGYYDQNGVIVASNFKRYSGLFNINGGSKKLSFSSNLNFSHTVSDGSVYSSGGNNTAFAGVITKTLFSRPLGNRTVADEDDENIEEEDILGNPYLFATTTTNINNQTRVTGSVQLDYKLTDDFKLTVKTGGNLNYDERLLYFPKETTENGRRLNGYGSIGNSRSIRTLVEGLAQYNKRINRFHNITVLAGATREDANIFSTRQSAQEFDYDQTGVFDIGLAKVYNVPYSNLSENALLSYLTRINYGYKGKYLLTLTGRVDGASKFPDANKFAFFPSGALAWRVSEEKFLKNSKVINNLKLRYTFGATGNQGIPAYQSIAALGNVTYSFGGGLVTGVVPSRFANEDLRWETTYQHNAGFDLGLFQNKLAVTFDVYKKNTVDILMQVPVSDVFGLADPFQNVGEIENKGIELDIVSRNVNKSNFTWRTDFNLGLNRNKIISLGPAEFINVSFGPEQDFTDLVRYQVGQPIGTFYGYITEGIIKSKEELDAAPKYPNANIGNWRVKDINGDNIINADDRTITGVFQPKFFGGITNEFTFFKDWDLSAFLSFKAGHELYNANLAYTQLRNDSRNKTADVLDRTFKPATLDSAGVVIDAGNPNGDLPSLGNTSLFTAPISKLVEDASYLRLANLTLGYTIPPVAAKRLKVSMLRAYVSANNLFTLTNYSGYDPDVNITRNNGLLRGVDWGSYPNAKTIIMGVNAAF